jgi:hypothetical protein
MYNMECKRCKNNFSKQSHYMIDIYIQNNFPLTFCNKHKNFKPNKLIVWFQHKYHLHYKYPKHYMRIHKVGYREGKLMYYRFKYGQEKIFFSTRFAR